MRKIKVLLSWLVGMILCLCNAQAGHWTCNPSDFQYDMVAYVGLQIDGAMVTIIQDYEVAAFVGDECRGVAVCEIVDDSGFGYYSLRIRSNEESGEIVTFKYYDAVHSVEKELEINLTFEHQAIVGVPSKPLILECRNRYRLTYLLDGAEYSVDSITYGTELVQKDALTKEGHTFSGWSEIPETMPAKDVTVEGSFTVNRYTLLYMVDDVEYKRTELEYGTSIIAEAAPVKEGYIFSGWSEIPEIMPAEDVIVTGSFEIDGINAVITNKLVDVYSLQGVIVKRQIPMEGLQRGFLTGVYIVNGKKMVVK